MEEERRKTLLVRRSEDDAIVQQWCAKGLAELVNALLDIAEAVRLEDLSLSKYSF
eukprot:gene21763-26177_t